MPFTAKACASAMFFRVPTNDPRIERQRGTSGSVALALFVTFGYHVVRSSSDRKDVEQLVDETYFVLHVRLARDAMASADHPHHLKALDPSGCSLYCLKTSSRPYDLFECAVIRLDDLVEVLARRSFVLGASLPSCCKRPIALGHKPRWSVVIEDGGQWRIVVRALPRKR